MKTIQVSDEMYDKLISLAKEMIDQDPRGTKMPHMFQIRDWKRVFDDNLNGEHRLYIDYINNHLEIETLEDFKDYLFNNSIEEPEDLDEMWNDDYSFELEDFIEENCPDLTETTYSYEPVYINCFFTAKEAQAHLDSNYYHYHVNADVYLNHAWRNPEMDLISEFLCSLIGEKIYT